MKTLKAAVLGKGESDPDLRQKLFTSVENAIFGQPSPLIDSPELHTYVDKVTNYAYKVVDDDLEKLKAKGFSEDEIFEITVTVAAGAGLGRLKRGLELLQKT